MTKDQIDERLRNAETAFKETYDVAYGSVDSAASHIETIGFFAGRGNLIESYIKRDIGLHIHFHTSLPSPELETGDYAFLIQKASTSIEKCREGDSFRRIVSGTCSSDPRCDDVNSAVTVNPCPIIENPKSAVKTGWDILSCEIAWSVVRLYRFNNSNDVGTLLFEWTKFPGAFVEFAETGSDGKLQYLFIGRRILSSLKDSGLIDACVEGGSVLVEHFSDFERYVRFNYGRDIARDWLDQNGSGPVVIYLDKSGVGAVFHNQFCDRSTMSFCTFNAEPTRFKW